MKRRSVVALRAGALDAVLAEALGVPLREAAALVQRGAVYVEGRRCEDLVRKVPAGAKLLCVLEEAGARAAPAEPQLALSVLFEDERLLVVDKPAGVPAQPTASRTGHDLLALASAHLGRTAGLVHRLDKDTTGVTVFAKTRDATAELAAEFREGRARKTYLAAVGGALSPSGTIDLPLSKDPRRVGRWRASAKANGIAAVTRFERLGVCGPWALVALFPQTGRTHQLRAHLTALEAPILGDRLYGGAGHPATASGPAPGRCLLHAFRLELLGQRFEAPVPDDLAAYFRAAGTVIP